MLPWHQLLLAEGHLLPVTPGDAEGPFYPVEIPADSDNDLLRVMGQETVSPGQLAYVHGKVMDRDGKAIDGARVEIWQCDNGGVYHHPGDEGTKDNSFQGFGAMVTNREGEYHFRTLRPVPYTGRTPHIHYRVTAEGFDRLTTQLYVEEEAQRNAEDFLYKRHSESARALVTTSFSPAKAAGNAPVAAGFNIVLG
jgi:protocatechuate 3,4-dioxygenase beta subunit